MKVYTFAQRSPEWHEARLGVLTGSRVADVFALSKKDGRELAARANLRLALALEQVTGRTSERVFVTQAMQDGIDREPEARALYQAESGNLVEEVGFYRHDTLAAGYSPDGVIGDVAKPEGLIENKCPEPAAHWEFVDSGRIPGDYMRQIAHGLWITGAAWCDFVSYNPHFPVSIQLRVLRVENTPLVTETAMHGTICQNFLHEVDDLVSRIRTKAGAA